MEPKCIVFDEPTAGLDPVFRKELLDYFFEIVADGSKSILISTHLTDELDKIADYILFLEDGRQKLFAQKEELISRYKLIRGTEEQIEAFSEQIIGKRITPNSCEALIEVKEQKYMAFIGENQIDSRSVITSFENKPLITTPTIEDIMYYFIKGSVSN